MYLHNHRSGTNGTPLDRRFTNWALELRRAGYDPALFGYTHTAPDPRYMTPDDPRLGTDEGILPGITPVVDMATHCGPWRDWLKGFGYPLPDDHGATYGQRIHEHRDATVPRPSLYSADHTDTRFLVQSAMDYIGSARAWRTGLAERAGLGGASVGARTASAVGGRAAIPRPLSAARAAGRGASRRHRSRKYAAPVACGAVARGAQRGAHR